MAICIGCGCTDHNACEEGCWWIRLSERLNVGVCSSEACTPHRERFDADDFTRQYETAECPVCHHPQRDDQGIGFESCPECGHCAHTQQVNNRCLLCDADVPRRRSLPA